MYSSAEAAEKLGVSRNTLLRWFREGRIGPVARDHRGWRCFSEADLARIRADLGMERRRPATPPESGPRARMRAYLRRVPAFRPLAGSLLDELAQSARFQGYLAGARLYAAGDRCRGPQILVKGRVRIFRISADGREQILSVATPYQTLGESALFRPDGRHVSYASCLEGSTVLLLPTARMHLLTREHPELALRFLSAFSDRIETLEARLEELAFLSLEQRVARYLLDLARSRGVPEKDAVVVDLDLSTGEIASLLGGARESVSRVFVRFRREGLLSRSGRHVALHDLEALERV